MDDCQRLKAKMIAAEYAMQASVLSDLSKAVAESAKTLEGLHTSPYSLGIPCGAYDYYRNARAHMTSEVRMAQTNLEKALMHARSIGELYRRED